MRSVRWRACSARGQLVPVAVQSQRRERARPPAVARPRDATGSRPSASPPPRVRASERESFAELFALFVQAIDDLEGRVLTQDPQDLSLCSNRHVEHEWTKRLRARRRGFDGTRAESKWSPRAAARPRGAAPAGGTATTTPPSAPVCHVTAIVRYRSSGNGTHWVPICRAPVVIPMGIKTSETAAIANSAPSQVMACVADRESAATQADARRSRRPWTTHP